MLSMLPNELADDLCSLRPNQERLTVTVEIPIATTTAQDEEEPSTDRPLLEGGDDVTKRRTHDSTHPDNR